MTLQVWDTAGQERFHAITLSYYRRSNCVLIVFDVTNKNTFESIPKRLKELKSLTEEDCRIILIGNKTDLIERVVSKSEAMEFAMTHGLDYFETSAKESINVEETFNQMAKELLEKTQNHIEISRESFHLDNGNVVKDLDENSSYWDYFCSIL